MKKEYHLSLQMRKEPSMSSVSQLAEVLEHILNGEANQLARETKFIQRERALSGADWAQTLIFGWLEEPEISLDGLTQVAARREVKISASGLNQRFSESGAAFLQRLLQRLTEAGAISLRKRVLGRAGGG